MKKIYLILIVFTIYSCTNDSISDLIPVEEEIEGEGEPITFITDVQPIINNNCMPCHDNPPRNGAPISLTTFEEVMTATQVTGGNGVIDRISRQPGQAGFMPLGRSRLPQNLIDLIIEWRDEGFLEE